MNLHRFVRRFHRFNFLECLGNSRNLGITLQVTAQNQVCNPAESELVDPQLGYAELSVDAGMSRAAAPLGPDSRRATTRAQSQCRGVRWRHLIDQRRLPAGRRHVALG
jgi:hypothetical protein